MAFNGAFGRSCHLYMSRIASHMSKSYMNGSGQFAPKRIQPSLTRSMSSSNYSFDTLAVTQPKDYVFQVELNRPKKLNAMNNQFWIDMRSCFKQIAEDPDCRVIVLSGAGRVFTSGLDLKDAGDLLMNNDGKDVARQAFAIKTMLNLMQESFTVIEKCTKPVIAAVHNACLGGGIDMISSCDIRFCTQDAFFAIKEIDLGLSADLGTLQRFPKVIGNDSLARELVYTARNFHSDEAKEHGFVSRVFPDKETMMDSALELATTISSKSPVAVQGSKVNLVYARDHTVQESLDFQVAWNIGMLQSEDVVKAVMASIQKETPEFSKL